jgi:p-hydroxybenzoate 3-monooxygenase
MSTVERTQVGIVGAGPAGLLLAHLLDRAGVSSVVLEARTEDYVRRRVRAGVLEQGTTDLLREVGLTERMDVDGLVHDGIELRFGGTRHRIDMAALTGRHVTIWGQTEVVKDLIDARRAAGRPPIFEATDVAVHDVETRSPRVSYSRAGTEHELHCEAIAGCDGFHGVCREAIPAAELQVRERAYPFAWLGVLADVAPSCDELIYARHDRGFALHSMRSPSVSRLYLQVDPAEDIADWSDDRIWTELAARFDVGDGWTLADGPITEKGVTPMRSFVAAPMRYGRLLLAGDAAHIVPPTGAKGLNLAVSDVRRLAEALTALVQRGDERGVDAYSGARLHRVWRAQHFSWWMTQMLHVDPAATPYELELQQAQLAYVASSEAAATTLAENYVGLPGV